MTQITRIAGYALALVLLSLAAFTAANGQTARYNYGFCQGIAGVPPTNVITRSFVLGPTNGDLRGGFIQGLGQKYGGEVRRDATGCRMFPTASEAEATRHQLLEQSRTMSAPVVEINWIPQGATALSGSTPAPAPTPAVAATKPKAPAPTPDAAAPVASAAVQYDMWGKPIPTTAWWVCDSHFTKDSYVTPPFLAGTDSQTQQDMFQSFLDHLHKLYHEAGTASCNKFTTQAEAEQSTAQQAAKAPSTGYQFHLLNWTYAPGAPAVAAPAPAPAKAPTPAANAAVTPKPALVAVAAKPASPAPAKSATVASKPAMYVTCRADWNPDLRRFYNPPVDGRGAGYPEWQASWHKYLVDHYGFKESNFGCGKYPTKEAAQTDYDYWVSTARATPSVNGLPSPVIITNWTY